MGMGGEIFENLQTGGPLQLPSQEYILQSCRLYNDDIEVSVVSSTQVFHDISNQTYLESA